MVLNVWLARAKQYDEQHEASAKRNARCHFWLGIGVITLVTVSGASFLVELSVTHSWIKILIGILGIFASFAAGVQTFANFGKRSEAHRATSVRCKKLISLIESNVVFPPKTVNDGKAGLRSVQEMFSDIEENAPLIEFSMKPITSEEALREQLQATADSTETITNLGYKLWVVTEFYHEAEPPEGTGQQEEQ